MNFTINIPDDLIQEKFNKHVQQDVFMNEAIKEGLQKQKDTIVQLIKDNIQPILFDPQTTALLRERIVNLLARRIVESRDFWINNIIEQSTQEISHLSYIDRIVESIIKKTIKIIKEQTT